MVFYVCEISGRTTKILPESFYEERVVRNSFGTFFKASGFEVDVCLIIDKEDSDNPTIVTNIRNTFRPLWP